MRSPLKLLFLLALVWGGFNLFWQNGAIALWDQDEAAYAGFAHNILSTGNWVTPDFLWSDPHRKPPLHFWAIALSFKLFGEQEFALRFPSALAVLLTGCTIYVMGRSAFGEQTARLATIIVFSSLLLPNLGKVSLTDALLVLWQTIALLALCNTLVRPRGLWTVLLWGAVSLGVLTKGPPILILVLGSLVTLALFSPQRRHLIALHPWVGLPLSLIPLLVWGRMAWVADGGEYIQWMIDWYIVKRASGGITFGQWGPPGYFLLVFCLGFLPWVIFFPAALGDLGRNLWRKREQPLSSGIAAWLIWGWLAYEFIPSKLPSYALGAYGAIALLIAQTIIHPPHPRFPWGTRLFLLLSLLLTVGLGGAGWWLLGIRGGVLSLLVGVFWLGWAIATIHQLQRGHLENAITLTTCNGLILTFLIWGFLMPLVNLNHSATQQVAQQIAQTTPPETLVIFADYFDLPSLPFYVAQQQREFIGLENNPLPQLQTYYEREQSTVLIFNQTPALQQFLDQLAAAHLPTPQQVPVRGWFSQMGTLETYTVVWRE